MMFPRADLKARRYARALVCAASLVVGCGGGASAPTTLNVSVGSSLSDVMGTLARRYEAAGGDGVAINAAASNTLARQIVNGAPVDLFVSADEAQMTVVANADRIVPASRVRLLTNQLVVVTGRDSTLSNPATLADVSVARVAMGQPDSVPAGVYGREWLQKIGVWPAVQPKVVPLPTVRGALAAVREGRADAAIVYVTDARSAPELRVAYRVPKDEGPDIVYPAAMIRGKNAIAAQRFLAYLRSPDARGVFEAAGFGVLP